MLLGLLALYVKLISEGAISNMVATNRIKISFNHDFLVIIFNSIYSFTITYYSMILHSSFGYCEFLCFII